MLIFYPPKFDKIEHFKESVMKTSNTPSLERIYAALATILERKHGVKITYQITQRKERRTS